MIDRVEGRTQIRGIQESSEPSVSCVEDIVKRKSECNFSRMVRSVGRLERVKIRAGFDLGK